MTDRPCNSTRHCIDHGFCHRCDQNLTDASKLIVQAIPMAGIPDHQAGEVYTQVMALLSRHALSASDVYDQRLKARMSGQAAARLKKLLGSGTGTRRAVKTAQGAAQGVEMAKVENTPEDVVADKSPFDSEDTHEMKLAYIGDCTCATGPGGQHEGHCGYVPVDREPCPSGRHPADPCPGGCAEPSAEAEEILPLSDHGQESDHVVVDGTDEDDDECGLPMLMPCDCNHISGCQYPKTKDAV